MKWRLFYDKSQHNEQILMILENLFIILVGSTLILEHVPEAQVFPTE